MKLHEIFPQAEEWLAKAVQLGVAAQDALAAFHDRFFEKHPEEAPTEPQAVRGNVFAGLSAEAQAALDECVDACTERCTRPSDKQ